MFTSSPDNGSGGSRKPAGSPRRGGTRSAVPARATRRATLQLAALYQPMRFSVLQQRSAVQSVNPPKVHLAWRARRSLIAVVVAAETHCCRDFHIVAVVAMATVQCPNYRLIVAPDGHGELYRTRSEHQPLLQLRSHGRQVPPEPSELAHAAQLCPLPKPRRDLAAQGTQALLPLHQLHLREVSTNRRTTEGHGQTGQHTGTFSTISFTFQTHCKSCTSNQF